MGLVFEFCATEVILMRLSTAKKVKHIHKKKRQKRKTMENCDASAA